MYAVGQKRASINSSKKQRNKEINERKDSDMFHMHNWPS